MHARSIIAKTLGALWILDGLLQFQPQMFGVNFINEVLVPTLSAQPAIIERIVSFGIFLWQINPPLADIIAAFLQIGIGLLLLYPLSSKMCKTGLWISIFWGIAVWLCGEGMGALFTGGANFYTGAPGAVFIYIILAIFLLWPGRFSLRWYPLTAALLFLFGALLQLQSAFWTVDGVQDADMAAMMEPVHVVSAFPVYLSGLLAYDPAAMNIILILALLAVGGALFAHPTRTSAIVALVFLFFVWWIGQDFGMLSTVITGTPTDPQTAPLIALLILPILLRRKSAVS